MKFGPVSPQDALGATAVHSIRQGDLVLKKGTLIGPKEVAALTMAGVTEIVVARVEPGDVPEDQAAADIAAATAGAGVRPDHATRERRLAAGPLKAHVLGNAGRRDLRSVAVRDLVTQ